MTRYNEPNSIPKELKGIKKRLDSIERSQIGPQLLTEKSEMRTPAPPGNFTVSSSVQISETGETNGVVNASWDPVTEATFGTPLEIAQYELWGRPAQDGIWRRLTASPETSGEYGPLPTGESWTFRVRAIARSSTSPGEYSNEVTLTVAGDTTPPPVPSKPILTTRLGVISVQWDGMPSMPSDFSRIEIAMGPSSSPTSVIGSMSSRGSVPVADQPYGELRYFRFRSVDRSGNRSNWSPEASIATEALVDEDLINTTIDSQIQEAKDKVADLEGVLDGVSEDVSEASQAAIDAQAAADKAIQDALNALQAAQGKNKVVIAPEAPSDTSELSIGDIFYNTTSNETYVWDGADWKSVGTVDVDVIIDALTASGGVIDLLEKEVDKKITTYYGAQPSSPSEGDLWLDSSDPEDMIVKRWNGTAWERFDNPLVEAAYELAGDAKAIADRKVQTFAGTSFPANNSENDLGVGDLFINTTTKKTYRWSGSAWAEILDTAGTAESAIHAALTDPDGIVQEIRNQADRAINTFYGSSTPSGDVQEGDLWLDSSDPNNSRLKRYNGSSWELFDNPLIQSAYEQVQNKFTLHYGDSAPSDLKALWIKGGVPHIYVDYGAEAVNWLNHDTGLSNWDLYPASSGGSAEYNEGMIVLKGYGSRAESPIIPIETADPIRVATLIKTFGRAPGREDEQDARVLFGYHWYDENGNPTTTTPTQSASALYVKEGQWDQQSRALTYNDHVRGFRLRVSLSNQWTGDEIHIAASDIWQGDIRPPFDGDSPGFKWNGERFASTSSYAGPGWYPVVDPEVREAVARANGARQIADEKVRTFAQSNEPTGLTTLDIGDLWIDTDNHHIFRWDGSNWVEVVDPEASADSRIQAALQDGGLLEDLKNQVDAQIDTYYGATAPSSPKSGDLWLDQSNPDNARLKRYNGTTWDIFENPLVQSAYETAQEALDEADKKIQTFAQSSAPANNTTNDLGRGDLWIDTDDNSLHRWDGSKWAPVIDPAATARSQIQAALGPGGLLEDLKNQVDAQIDTYYGSSTPSSPKEGDLWLDQSDPDNARLKRYDGSSWQIFENPLVQSAYQTAQDALGEADKKIRTFAQDSEPTGMTSDDVGDLWIDTNDKNKLYRYNGTSWVVLRDETIQDAFDLANTKGRIIFSPTAPTSAEDKKPQNMWIDTSLRDDPNGGAQIPKNTPHRWSGSAWVPITDADVIAAAKAAADARQAAQEAHEAAGSAQDTADEALSSANGKTSVYHSDSPPSGTGSPGDLWWQHGTGVNSGTIVGQWRWAGLPDFFINNYNTTTPFVHAQPLGNGEIRFTALHDGPHTGWSVGAQSNLADGKTYTHKFTSTGSIFVRVTSGGTLYQNTFTVTTEMLGDGGLWQKEEIGSEVIANLDVGKLTAGSGQFVNLDVANLLRTNILTVGSIDDPTIIADNTITTGKILVDQELWARLAQFVSIKAGQLDANEIWTNDAWIGHARAQMLTVGSVPSRALAIGVDELLLDPLWENSELWEAGGPLGGQVPNGSKFRWNTSSTYRQYGQSRVLYTYASSGSTSLSAGDRVYLSPDVKTVSPGDEFRLAYEARTTTSNHNVVLGIEVYNSSGVKISDEYVAPDELTVDDDGNVLSTAHPLNTMFVIDGIVTVPSGGFQIRPWIGVEPGQTPTTGYWYISKVSMRAVMASEVADWRTRITGRGLEVINPDDISVIRLGAFDNIGMDLYQARVELDEEGIPIKNDDGTDLIRPHHTLHLHEDGTIGAEDIYARQSFEYKGTELEERFDELPKGMLTRISVAGSSLTNIPSTGGFLDVAEIQFTMIPGRVYRIAAKPINALVGSSGTTVSARAVSASLYWTKDGTRPTRDSERIFMDNHTPPSTSLERVTFNCERLAHVNETEGPLTIRVLLSLASAERSLNVQEVLSLFAEDLGWDTGPNGGIVRNYMRANASTPPPSAPDPVRTYKKTYGYTWHRTWQENGVISSKSQDAAYQGQTPYYTTAGRYRSMVGVKNMTTDLQKATITRVRVRLRMDHSHSASGGTVVMGFHGSGSRPSTFSGTNYRPGIRFSRGQEKWITLPSSLYSDFKDGNIKGVSFYSSSRSSEYYVQMSPGRVAFEITYEKS